MTRRHPGYLFLAAALSTTVIPLTGSGHALPDTAAQPQEPRVIEIVARRFVFEPAEVEVTVGERVTLSVRSGDGVHGFEIKKFKVKKEIPRGAAPVLIEFTATEAGRFPILCSEYCGNGHDDMQGTLVVNAQDPKAP